jgi:PleD family two-component response regulator
MNGHNKFKILVIDDEKSNIIALTEILISDYKVLAVRNSLEAAKTAEEELPDLILLDILMPEKDGYTVLTEIKAAEKTKNIPIMFITGLGSINAEKKGLALGATDYITKPFHSSIVKLRVRNQIKILEQYRTIEKLSMIDQLTGLPNRRSFEERLVLEWNRAVRERMPISILIIDIDNFKYYNDFAARWGGEEFIVLLPGSDSIGAALIAGQIREVAEETTVTLRDGASANVTVSVGINTQKVTPNCDIDNFIHYADYALYAAKVSGRNRINIY